MEPSNQPARPPASSPRELAPELWFNTVVGLLLLYMGANFAHWLITTISGQTYHTKYFFANGTGPEVPYFQLQGYTAWTDAGMFLFGLTILFEVLVSVIRPIKMLILIALLLCVVSTVWNLIVCILVIKTGSPPLASGLAVAFGGWIIANLKDKLSCSGSAI